MTYPVIRGGVPVTRFRTTRVRESSNTLFAFSRQYSNIFAPIFNIDASLLFDKEPRAGFVWQIDSASVYAKITPFSRSQGTDPANVSLQLILNGTILGSITVLIDPDNPDSPIALGNLFQYTNGFTLQASDQLQLNAHCSFVEAPPAPPGAQFLTLGLDTTLTLIGTQIPSNETP